MDTTLPFLAICRVDPSFPSIPRPVHLPYFDLHMAPEGLGLWGYPEMSARIASLSSFLPLS